MYVLEVAGRLVVERTGNEEQGVEAVPNNDPVGSVF